LDRAGGQGGGTRGAAREGQPTRTVAIRFRFAGEIVSTCGKSLLMLDISTDF